MHHAGHWRKGAIALFGTGRAQAIGCPENSRIPTTGFILQVSRRRGEVTGSGWAQLKPSAVCIRPGVLLAVRADFADVDREVLEGGRQLLF